MIEVTTENGRLIAKGRGGISASVIESTISNNSSLGRQAILTTVCATYPRFIHGEVMTHRQFSRNAASSRAIPVAKMIKQVRDNPAMPIHWGKNQPGMQAHEELTGDALAAVQDSWHAAAKLAANEAAYMAVQGAHKQVVNRILEPFQFMHTIITATEWENFFQLRAHPDAQPEIQELALCIKALFEEMKSRFVPIWEGKDSGVMSSDAECWHLPFVTNEERAIYRLPVLVMASAARCARVSYLNHDGTAPNIQKDTSLFMQLVGSEPLHASPIEHQAIAKFSAVSGNFKGDWVQFRKLYENIHIRNHFNEFKE